MLSLTVLYPESFEIRIFLDRLDEPWEARRPKEKFTMRSTQLYAKAGSVVEVIIAKDIVGKISVSEIVNLANSSTTLYKNRSGQYQCKN